MLLDKLWSTLLTLAERAAREERGDSLINWVVMAVGLAAAAAAVVALLRPAIEGAANKIVSLLGG
ncbi:MAG: hypothetical protein ACRDPC_20570 [Solirubrobacteraceae bacterium]